MHTHVCKCIHPLRNLQRTCSCSCLASWYKQRVHGRVVPHCCTRRHPHIQIYWDVHIRRCTCMNTIQVCSRKLSCLRRSGVRFGRRRSSIRPRLNIIFNSIRVIIRYYYTHTMLLRRVIINVITQVNKQNLLILLVTITL